MVKKRTCIFISGYGSNLKYLINNSRNQNFPIKISLVVCNNKNAKGILHAKKNSIPCLIINTNKRNFENKILNELKKYFSRAFMPYEIGYMSSNSKKKINFFNSIKW